VQREGFGLVIVDNASDVFDADEINRAMVRGFMRAMVQMVKPHGGAVLLLAHVDKITARAGRTGGGAEGYSGSTAWHNSARSRLLLVEVEPGLLELQQQKSNLGRKQPPLRIEWATDDVMRAVETRGGLVASIEAKNDMRSLLGLVHEFYGRGEWVACAPTSPSNAARLLSRERGFPKYLKPAEVFGLLRDAERANFLTREAYKDGNRKPHERWALTQVAYEMLRIAPTAPTAPPSKVGIDCAGVAPTAPPSVRGVWGVERAQEAGTS
jgi:putative DNA primase/helicase